MTLISGISFCRSRKFWRPWAWRNTGRRWRETFRVGRRSACPSRSSWSTIRRWVDGISRDFWVCCLICSSSWLLHPDNVLRWTNKRWVNKNHLWSFHCLKISFSFRSRQLDLFPVHQFAQVFGTRRTNNHLHHSSGMLTTDSHPVRV